MRGSVPYSLTAAVCVYLATVTVFGQAGIRVSAPITHKNLTIYLIHGSDTRSTRDVITLQEAMEMKVFKVYETEDVNELIVENISPNFDVFIQAGDIVKGGKQDRVLAISIIIPRLSGKVSIEAFCVESERWEKRGDEDLKEFSSSDERIVSRQLKIATFGTGGSGSGSGNGYGDGTGSGGGSGSGTGSALTGGFTIDGASGAAPIRVAPGTVAETVEVRGSQQEVWAQVSKVQTSISNNVTVDVTDTKSSSSLQLSLENKKLKKATEDFVKKFAGLTKGKSDVIGYAFAINGEINSADIYPSNHLFAKLWPRMLRAAVIEAISLDDKPKAPAAPTADAVKRFIDSAERGRKSERKTVAKSKVVTRSSKDEVVYEARDKSGLVIHRNYVKLE